MLKIEGKPESGNGFARQLGYPTVNLYQKSDNCGVFVIDDKVQGPGIAFVMPSLTEIHFLMPLLGPVDEIEAEIVDRIDPPENGILDYFYKGLESVKNSERRV
jgi:FAD synthase